MQADNIPTIADVGEDQAPPSWASLWKALAPHSASLAKAMAQANGGVPWSVALEVSAVADAMEDPNGVGEKRNRLGALADMVALPWFLIVVGGTVQVLHHMRPCRPLDANGGAVAGFVGDMRVTASGRVMPPKLCRPGSVVNDQHLWFGKVSYRAPTMADIQAAFAADDAPDVVGEPAEGGGEATSTWAALQVHPKVACVFLDSPTVSASVGRFAELYQLVPEGDRPQMAALARFVRMAAVGQEGSPRLARGWERLVPQGNEALEEWCVAMEEAYVHPRPVAIAAAEAAPRIAEVIHKEVKEKGEGLSRSYTLQELNDLYVWCGREPDNPAHLDPADLTPFLMGMEGVRGKQAPLRRFVENFLHTYWPKDQPSFQFFLSPEVIKSIGAVNFFGHDSACRWSQRAMGLSVFSFYPLSDGKDPGSKRAQAMAYEDTMGVHNPEERRAMDQMSACEEPVPKDRSTMWTWVMFHQVGMRMMFGSQCGLVGRMKGLVEALNQATLFQSFGPNDWRAYFWKYHLAVRHFFRPGVEDYQRLRIFDDLLNKVRQGEPVAQQSVPAEILAGVPGPAPTLPGEDRRRRTSSGGRRSGGSPEGDPPQARANSARRLAREWARRLEAPWKEAKVAYTNIGKNWTPEVVFGNGLQEAFGDMLAVVKPNSAGVKDPCPNLFVHGKCGGARCPHSHVFTAEPSRSLADKYTTWVRSKCNQIKRDPGNY